MSDLVVTRLFFADGSSELVALPAEQARREHYHRTVVTGCDDQFVHTRTVAFRRVERWVSPDFVGPLPSDDVEKWHDLPGRDAMVRDVGEDAARRVFGPSREGWRSVGTFVEVAAR